MFFREKKKEDAFADVSTVRSQAHDLTAEEFPEGPYGSSLEVESLGKSTPWHSDQHGPNPFGYENRTLHEGLPRLYPFADPLNKYDFPTDHDDDIENDEES